MNETAALWVEGLETRALVEFFPGDELHDDFGNWYLPTLPALHALCKAAGFSKVRTIVGPPDGRPADDRRRPAHFRALVHALV